MADSTPFYGPPHHKQQKARAPVTNYQGNESPCEIHHKAVMSKVFIFSLNAFKVFLLDPMLVSDVE
jgi:hypothetical protein